ncbi:hypothetical protein GP924_21130 [Enterobacteriaceae bacterium 8376wB9]|nr:hypothetical protein [Enterobacteriaceae bacterium 8376wB9]
MQFQNEDQDLAIISETAWYLALAMRIIDVIPLIAKLESMIEVERNDERVASMVHARSWLLQFTVLHRSNLNITYLNIVVGINE